ncbi:MAG: metallophosphoesterase [Acidobacteriota bacterium]
MSAASNVITLLHLSDLHARIDTDWDAKRVTEELVADLQRLQADDGLRPDLVLFTGDLAWAGQPEEFERGWNVIRAIQEAYETPLLDSAIFLVPGNHDVDRDRVGPMARTWHAHTRRDEVEAMIRAGGEDWRHLTTRLDGYRNFLDSQALTHLQTDASRAIWHAHHDVRGCSIGLAGFNTAWSCGQNDERGKLWMGARWQHATLSAAVRDAEVRIALLHHPPSWLHEHEAPDLDRALPNDFHLTLHGHEHRAWVTPAQDGHATLAAGAGSQGSRRPNGYSVIKLDRRAKAVRVHLRQYDADGGGWVARPVAKRAPKGVWTYRAPWLPDALPTVVAPAAADGEVPAPSVSSAASPGAAHALLERFRRTQRNENADIQLVGFPVRLKLDVALSDVYVPLRASLHDALREGKAFGGSREALQRLGDDRDVPLDEAFKLAREHKRRGLVVLGEPGSGKTTLLKHFLLTDPSRLQLPADTVPVLVLLRRLAQPDAGLRAALCATIREAAFFTEARAEALADHLLGDARVLLLLDGFDEIGDAEERARTARWIEKAARQQGTRWTFVLTSRYAGYKAEARLRGSYAELHVRDLTSAEAGSFIQRWYRVVIDARGKGPNDRPATRADADPLSAALHARIFDKADARGQSLRLLACNPMMLQILCLLQWDQGQLPERRAALYEACVRTLLQLWRKDLGLGFDADAAQAVLEPLAWHLHVAGAEELPRGEIEPVIAGPLRAQRRVIDLLPDAFLDAVRDRTGVLVSTGRDHFGFLHLSFQEYLAARHVRSQVVNRPKLVNELASRFDVQAWREVILLALGLTSPPLFGPVMHALIGNQALSRNPSLASDCLRDAAEPSAAPLLEALADGVEDDGERFQVLRLLKSDVLGDWIDVAIEDGRTGREVLRAPRSERRGAVGRPPIRAGRGLRR